VHPVVRKLSLFATLSADEARAIERACSDTFVAEAQSPIAREDEPPINVFFLLEGFACRSKFVPSGRRQILSFMIPGDSCDVGISALERRDHSITTLAPSVWARVPDATLLHLVREHPKIQAALNWATLVEEAIGREWIVNVGARSALSRAGHVFYELYHRLHAIGLADRLNYQLPLIQTDLADALGISPVHANRTLQELRRQKLLAFGDKRMIILDLKGLEEVAEFEPTYLHLQARYQGEAA
jgi:CRP-like cAMP-binding protein